MEFKLSPMKRSKVKFLHPTQFWGRLEDGTHFSFHNTCRFVFDGGDGPVRLYERVSLQLNDAVVYRSYDGKRGPKAKWLALEKSLVLADQQVDARLTYRLIEQTEDRSIPNRPMPKLCKKYTVTCVLWEGKDLRYLRQHFPILDYPIGRIDYCTYLTFQVKVKGEWQHIDRDIRETPLEEVA